MRPSVLPAHENKSLDSKKEIDISLNTPCYLMAVSVSEAWLGAETQGRFLSSVCGYICVGRWRSGSCCKAPLCALVPLRRAAHRSQAGLAADARALRSLYSPCSPAQLLAFPAHTVCKDTSAADSSSLCTLQTETFAGTMAGHGSGDIWNQMVFGRQVKFSFPPNQCYLDPDFARFCNCLLSAWLEMLMH